MFLPPLSPICAAVHSKSCVVALDRRCGHPHNATDPPSAIASQRSAELKSCCSARQGGQHPGPPACPGYYADHSQRPRTKAVAGYLSSVRTELVPFQLRQGNHDFSRSRRRPARQVGDVLAAKNSFAKASSRFRST